MAVTTETVPYVMKYVVERFPKDQPPETVLESWRETLSHDALLIRDEILKLHIKPRAPWIPKFIYAWLLKRLVVCTWERA